ncbi:hypothetical protein GNI_081940 [Gregarina niphandrodes]|uniref:EF-hand domain-containing protein n=1 Tax=Gregarina niphandrodes TaxID=110365 RepID=A0A023B6E2_GRENI|nr:hypothetical protein GNI_081940 [Gregarina niphandrodes]EZG65893.1 hypothetical protein GNI_081940 [Gregarina niphandrodes]|eukprot:XP_011134051.1 hypothetical protein GNI_081940 [Gregarina niphandrodes]
MGIPPKIPADVLDELQSLTGLPSSTVVVLYERFRALAPQGFMSYVCFKKSLGLMALLDNSFLPERLFKAFDFRGDGVLDFVEWCAGLGIMMKGSEDERLEFSFRILRSPGKGVLRRGNSLTGPMWKGLEDQAAAHNKRSTWSAVYGAGKTNRKASRLPMGVFPPARHLQQVTTATLVPAPLVPAPLVPAPLAPAPLVPAPLVPAPLVPVPLVPAPLVPAPLVPAPLVPATMVGAPIGHNAGLEPREISSREETSPLLLVPPSSCEPVEAGLDAGLGDRLLLPPPSLAATGPAVTGSLKTPSPAVVDSSRAGSRGWVTYLLATDPTDPSNVITLSEFRHIVRSLEKTRSQLTTETSTEHIPDHVIDEIFNKACNQENVLRLEK